MEIVTLTQCERIVYANYAVRPQYIDLRGTLLRSLGGIICVRCLVR